MPIEIAGTYTTMANGMIELDIEMTSGGANIGTVSSPNLEFASRAKAEATFRAIDAHLAATGMLPDISKVAPHPAEAAMLLAGLTGNVEIPPTPSIGDFRGRLDEFHGAKVSAQLVQGLAERGLLAADPAHGGCRTTEAGVAHLDIRR